MRPRLEEKHLVNEHRLPDNVEKILYLLLYTPLGVALFCIRIVCGLIALLLASALPDVATLRSAVKYILTFSLGVYVRTEKKEIRDKNVKIIVSNHVSGLDHLALHLACDSYSPTKYRMQEVLENSLGLYYVNGEVNTNIFSTSNRVLGLFPEQAVTNGKGLLKFKSKMFEKIFEHSVKVQPVSIQVWRPPVADIAIKSIGSQWWSDLISYLFVPCTVYTIKFLPVVIRTETTTDEDLLAEEIREVIGNSLKIPRTNLTAKDLTVYEKRYLFEQQRSLDTSSRSSNLQRDPQLVLMARQVKEVLPLVPQQVIIQDLIKTRNIDYTISNILDGHVRYTPETVSSSPMSQPSQSSSVLSPSTSSQMQQQKGFMSTFPKNSNERMMTFKERKRELIENARKKYIEKNGLNIALNNC